MIDSTAEAINMAPADQTLITYFEINLEAEQTS